MSEQLPEWLVEIDGKRYFKLSRIPRPGDTVYWHSPEGTKEIGKYVNKSRILDVPFARVRVGDSLLFFHPKDITAVEPLEDGESP
jgi:hypothetical protein